MTRPDPITVWGLLHEAHDSVTAIAQEDVVQALDLPWTWFEVLIRLERSGGTLSRDDLVTQMTYLSGGPVGLLGRIEDAGLVSVHGGDGAGTLQVSLTSEGAELTRRAVGVHLDTLDRCVIGLLDDTELAAFETALRRIRDHNHPGAAALH